MSSLHGRVTSDGIVFGPTASGKTYLSWFAHRGAIRGKSQWLDDLKPPEEFAIFCCSESSNWNDGTGNYWGMRDERGTPLGTRGERLAKFPSNSVDAAPWHGYPVLTSGANGGAPPDALVARWIDQGSITRTFGLKIQRRRA